jgi:hypothetical protein
VWPDDVQEETYRLHLAIRKYAETLPGDHGTLRFWGRINTRAAPYYIIEGATFEDPGQWPLEVDE